jgi:hypothetical protein
VLNAVQLDATLFNGKGLSTTVSIVRQVGLFLLQNVSESLLFDLCRSRFAPKSSSLILLGHIRLYEMRQKAKSTKSRHNLQRRKSSKSAAV